MYIYIGTNKGDGKQYVGQSNYDPHERRIKDQLKVGKSNLPIHNAIRKYGAETSNGK